MYCTDQQPSRTAATDQHSSPVLSAWVASGAPVPASFTNQTATWCSACGTNAIPMRPAHQVLSTKFTATDSWVYAAGTHLCAACAWAYTTPALRRSVYRIDQAPPARISCSRADLGAQLADRPLSHDEAAIIPVRGRRHILPAAQWGYVCTDDTSIRWDHHAAQLLSVLRLLRTVPGIRAGILNRPVPPITALRHLDPADGARLWQQWESLQTWREHPGSWWDAAIALSTPQ